MFGPLDIPGNMKQSTLIIGGKFQLRPEKSSANRQSQVPTVIDL
jgi:hypothetical protein